MIRVVTVAAFTVLLGTGLTNAQADDAPTSSTPSCEFGEAPKGSTQPLEVQAASRALFMKFCALGGGPLVNSGDPRLIHSLTPAGNGHARSVEEFYPPDAARIRPEGTTIVGYVVETNGKVTLAEVVKSSGTRSLDDAAVEFIKSTVFKSPAYLDFTPVRMYMALGVAFKLHH